MKKVLLLLLVSLGLQTQAQISLINCDSLEVTQYQDLGLSITLDTSNAVIGSIDSVSVVWGVCDPTICYSDIGITGNFPNVSVFDTLKVCYDASFFSVTSNNVQIIEYCSQCDSMIYDFNIDYWIPFGTSGINSINELTFNKTNSGKIYDMLGRELKETPIGQMYIQNRQKDIKLEK